MKLRHYLTVHANRMAWWKHQESESSRAARFWDQTQTCILEGDSSHWWSVPGMGERWNQKITGSASLDYFEYVAANYFSISLPRTALTVGCGNGYRERQWARHYRFERHDAFDVSEESIALASRSASSEGLDQLNYFVGDANKLILQPKSYDVVLFEQSLHHVTELEHVIAQVKLSLRPEGWIIVHEFIGASRFQWSDRQLEIVNGALALLPLAYRTMINSPDTTKVASRPKLKHLIQTDPSEAARSAEIPSFLRENFKIVQWKEFGGGLLHLLFEEIAGNFHQDSVKDVKLVKMLYLIEDILMEIEDLPSDFVFVVAQNT